MNKIFSNYVTNMTEDNVLNASSWFKDKVTEANSKDEKRESAFNSKVVNTAKLIRDNSTKGVSRVRLGHLYLFRYDAKLKQELPYYDIFPVIFIIQRKQDGFLGLNLHYLPYEFRASLMDSLYNFVVGEDDLQRLRATYNILTSTTKLRFFRPCLKHYLNTNIKSRFIHVDPDEWDTALFLPLHKFRKATAPQVYRDSIKSIRRASHQGRII